MGDVLGAWPFTGRAVEFEVAERALAAGTGGLVVAGDAGVGKTRLADEVRVALSEDRYFAVHVCATSASASIPFGSLSHLLPADGPGQGSTNLLGWAAQAVLDGAHGRQPVLCVDDAHMLDGASAALVVNLVRTRRATLLATIRSGQPVDEAVSGLWKDELVTRIELVPLGREAVTEVLEAALGGPLSAAAARRLFHLSAGNLLFLRELVRAGELVEADGMWHLRDTPRLPPRLAELIATRIEGLGAAEREVLELVALGEPIGLDLPIIDGGGAEALERKQLVTIVPDGRRLNLRLAHPLYGEVILAECPVTRVRRRYRQLADAIELAGARRSGDAMRLALWRLKGGVAQEPEPLLAASTWAWASQDLGLAQRFAKAAVDAGGGAEAAAALSMVLNVEERYDEAESVAAVSPPSEDERERALQATARAYNLAWGLGRADEAERILDDADSGVRTAGWKQQLMVARAVFGFLRGDPADALRWLKRLRALGTPSVRVAAECAVVESFVLAHMGSTVDAVAIASTWLATATDWREHAPHAEPALELGLFLAHVFAGDIELADQVATAAFERVSRGAGWQMTTGLFAGLRGQARRYLGRPIEGIRLCKEGLAHVEPGKGVVASFCLAEMALCHAFAGNAAEARSALYEANRRSPRAARMLRLTTRIAPAWVLAAEGNLDAATGAMLRNAAWLRRHDLPTVEIQVLHDVVRIGGAARVASRIGELARGIDGPFARCCAAHAHAYTVSNGKALEVAAEDFADLGMLLHAAEAAAHASSCHQTGGDVRSARAAAARAWTFADACDAAGTPAVRTLVAPGLTPREWEIAHLVAQNRTSKAIAEHLVVSVRTVDNHLGAIYQKLGISNRTELANLIRAPRPRPDAE